MPCDCSRPDLTLVVPLVSCKVRTVWEHSPTRRKENPMARINRGVNSPINCHFPLSYRTCTWRPTRAPTWPRGLPATWLRPPCAPPARATQALPRGLSASSQPGLVPRATSAVASPRQHLQVIKSLFRDFVNRK